RWRIKELNEALESAPEATDPRIELAQIYVANAMPRQAIGCLEQALSRIPRSAKAWYYLGIARAADGGNEQAVDAFRASLRLEPDHAGTQMRLGQVLLNSDATASLKALEEAVRLEPKSALIRLRLADALDKLGKTSDAGAAREKALELEPKCSK